jgi:hypothetical protein
MRSAVNWVLFAMSALCLLSGCSTLQGEHRPTAFVSVQRSYSVEYVDRGKRQLLPSPWVLSNFEYDGALPTKERTKGRFESEFQWEMKSGAIVRATTTTYELLFRHTSNAEIWVRLLPIPQAMRGRQVRYAAEEFVNSFSGSVVSDWLDGSGIARRVATQIIESKAIKVDGHPARQVTFDIANLDQLQLDPNAPRTRARIVLVKAGLRKSILHSQNLQRVAAYLMLGYLNDAARFADEAAAFDSLVQRVKVAPVE